MWMVRPSVATLAYSKIFSSSAFGRKKPPPSYMSQSPGSERAVGIEPETGT